MSKLGTAAFVGESGDKYDFSIYPIDVEMKPGHGGVYVVTARTGESSTHHSHHKIYIGETTDFSTIMENHPLQGKFEEEGANCICVLPVHEDHHRMHIMNDLLAHYDTVCN